MLYQVVLTYEVVCFFFQGGGDCINALFNKVLKLNIISHLITTLGLSLGISDSDAGTNHIQTFCALGYRCRFQSDLI